EQLEPPADAAEQPVAIIDAPAVPATTVDAPKVDADVTPQITSVIVHVIPANDTEYKVGVGDWQRLSSSDLVLPVGEHVVFRNPICQPTEVDVVPAMNNVIKLGYLPAVITPTCDRDVAVEINGAAARRNVQHTITFGDTTILTQTVTVEFLGGDKKDVHK